MKKKEEKIAVFDSGVGGLSVLLNLKQELKNENFIYFADTKHFPYGELQNEIISERLNLITNYLVNKKNIKLLVIACNTATTNTIKTLRIKFPNLLIIGVEPAIKPASIQSKTKNVGVLATKRTLESSQIRKLIKLYGNNTKFYLQDCKNLAKSIEENQNIEKFCEKYLNILEIKKNQIDTLVLACTHYFFVKNILNNLNPQLNIIDTSQAVTNQAKKVLQKNNLLNLNKIETKIKFLVTGKSENLTKMIQNRFNINNPKIDKINL